MGSPEEEQYHDNITLLPRERLIFAIMEADEILEVPIDEVPILDHPQLD